MNLALWICQGVLALAFAGASASTPWQIHNARFIVQPLIQL